MTPRKTCALALAVSVLCLCTACGVETASTAATAGAIKQNELEQGRATQERVQQQLNKALEQSQRRTADPLADGY